MNSEASYTVVIETPTRTITYELNSLDKALKKIKSEKSLYPEDCNIYVIDDYGNIIISN